MESVVRKWGNSAAIRIPARELKAANLSVDDPVVVRVDRGRIVIEAVARRAVSIDALVAAITPENMHEAVDTGAARGEEAW